MAKNNTEALKTILKGGNPGEGGVTIPTSKPNIKSDGPHFPGNPDEGDTFTDENGKEWEYKGNNWVSDNRTIKDAGTPAFCPECDGVMSHRNDRKMYRIYGMCFDCRIEEETKLRARGEWELFEKRRVLENMRDWLKDQRAELERFKEKTDDKVEHVGSDGRIMEWTNAEDFDELIEEYEDWLDQHEEMANELEEHVRELEENESEKDVTTETP